jgi:hypothetical protein
LMTELVTSMAVNDGTLSGGGVLLPGKALNLPPHVVGPAGIPAKPLNADGAFPPLTELAEFHCELQNVAVTPRPLFPLPITKFPPVVHWKTIVLADALDGR